jgi:tetratricopeptide (TPR) repeat protein
MVGVKQVDAAGVLNRSAAKLRAWESMPPLSETTDAGRGAADRGRWYGWIPGLDGILILLGRGALSKGFVRLGLWATEAAVSANPSSPAASLAAARARWLYADIRGALHYLQTAAKLDNSRHDGHWELAKLLLRLEREDLSPKQVAEARRQLIAALQIAQRSTDFSTRLNASIALANMLDDVGRCSEALVAAQAAVQTAPDNVRALRAKARALATQQRLADAIAMWRELHSNHPGSADIERKLQSLVRAEQMPEEESTARRVRQHIGSADATLLIGVGSGIGDMLHVTPTIRNIARRIGERVDVVVFADHPNAEFLVRNAQYVGSVLPLSQEVLDRHYRTVFLAHCFGPLRFAFNADRVCTSRSWRTFRPGHLHETLFNLEAARDLLGVSYDEEDVGGYFVGELVYRPPAETLIGLHAGSKSERWLSKRWPYFAELSARLRARGLRVASFGTTDEYVEGTENRTGGTIEDMCRSMLDCSHLVSNDSGVMHIASALGMPALALFAPTDAMTHLPLRSATTGLMLEKNCAPCEVKDHRYFSSGHCRCIAEIRVDAVEQKLLEMMADAGKSRPLISTGQVLSAASAA